MSQAQRQPSPPAQPSGSGPGSQHQAAAHGLPADMQQHAAQQAFLAAYGLGTQHPPPPHQIQNSHSAYAFPPSVGTSQHPFFGPPPSLVQPALFANQAPAGAIPPSLQLGHPAAMPSATGVPVAPPTFGSFAGLHTLPATHDQAADWASAHSRTNQARNDSMEHHFGTRPRGRGRKRRGPSHPVPSLPAMPTLLAPNVVGGGAMVSAPTSCNIVLLLLPDVPSPGERAPEPVLHVSRSLKYIEHLQAFGAVQWLENTPLSSSLLTLTRGFRAQLERGEFKYVFQELDTVLENQAPASVHQLPFQIMVPTSTANRRASTSSWHLRLAEPEEYGTDLTLGGYLATSRLQVNKYQHYVKTETGAEYLIIRLQSRVEFTSRAHTAFTSFNHHRRHQHTCVRTRMSHGFCTDNSAELTEKYQKQHLGFVCGFSDPDLTSDEEGRTVAAHRRNGEFHPHMPDLSAFPEDEWLSDDERLQAFTSRRAPSTAPSMTSTADPGRLSQSQSVPPRPVRPARQSGSNSAAASATGHQQSRQTTIGRTLLSGALPPTTTTTSPSAASHAIVSPSATIHGHTAASTLPPNDTLSGPASGYTLFPRLTSDMAWKETPLPILDDKGKWENLRQWMEQVEIWAINPEYPAVCDLQALQPGVDDMVDVSGDCRQALAKSLLSRLKTAWLKNDFTQFVNNKYRLASRGAAVGDGVFIDAMSDCFKLISQKEDAFISHRRPPFFTIVSGPSSTSASSQLALFGAFGALCGLYLVVLGRAPPGLSPLQFLYAISGGRLDAITQEDLTRWDPELLALMQDLRLQGPRIDFGNFRSGEWLDRICHFLGGPPNTVFRAEDGELDEIEANVPQRLGAWYAKEEKIFKGLSFGLDSPEFDAFNRGLLLPAKNGFNLGDAVKAFPGGVEAFVRMAWTSSAVTYDGIASSLQYDLTDVKVYTASHWVVQFSNVLGRPVTCPFEGATDADILQEVVVDIFTQALRTPPSTFKRLLPAAIKQGLLGNKAAPQPSLLDDEDYLVRAFYRCVTGSEVLLGVGMGDIDVYFTDNMSAISTSYKVPEFHSCSKSVTISLHSLHSIMANAKPVDSSRTLTTAQDYISFWFLISCLDAVHAYTLV